MTEKQKKKFEKLTAKHPGCLKLFRHGDFCDSYQGDAEEVARITGVRLTADSQGDKMASLPLMRIGLYLPMLIRSGYRIAICKM